jgi:ADP-ribose pyrophosphatase YjhB (NUDIX family)
MNKVLSPFRFQSVQATLCHFARGLLGSFDGNARQASFYCQEAVARLEECPTLHGRYDRYNGIHVDLEQLDHGSQRGFSTILRASLCQWLAEKRCAAWLQVRIEKSSLIAEAAKFGFRFHHAEGATAMLYMWLRPDECKIHPFATHQVGVAGCVVNSETSQVLVVKDKGQPHPLWKFPGGVADLGEDIGTTAEREILEETGLETEFKGILAFRQQHNQPGTFGRSDLFFVCHMSPVTFDLRPCEVEIDECQWMDLDELEQTGLVSAMTHHVLQMVRYGLQNGFRRVNIACEDRPSIYRGKRYQVYSRPIKSPKGPSADCMHDIVDASIDKLMS